MGEDEGHTEPRRLGVTHAIRTKLNFLDERLWKRFSARRLELIDTMDLSSRKASEQDYEIRKVAEGLREEFGYNEDYEQDFDKLVRAAVQSVRRNRKRSSKSKHGTEQESQDEAKKRLKGSSSSETVQDFLSYSRAESLGLSKPEEETELSDNGSSRRFLSEIAKINTDGQDEIYDLNYSRKKHFSPDDKAKATIDSMIRPRLASIHNSTIKAEENKSNTSSSSVLPRSTGSFSATASYTGYNSNGTKPPKLPPITSFHTNPSPVRDASGAKTTLINYIERSKSCSESVSKKSENIQALGKAIVSSSIAYIFEKSFENVNEVSMEYLRNKLNNELFLARFFRELDPNAITEVNDEIAVISLYTLLGGCVKDFGFEIIVFPLCEILYVSVLRDYPLIAKNSTPFRSADYLRPQSESVYTSNNSLSSLAAVATDMQMREHHPSFPPPLTQTNTIELSQYSSPIAGHTLSRSLSPEVHVREAQPTKLHSVTKPLSPHHNLHGKKEVLLRFHSSVLEFTYPTKNSAPPRLVEILENARSAFKLNGKDSIIFVKNVKDGSMLRSDFDLERIFKTQEQIELEIITQRSKDIPIYEITSTVVPNSNDRYPSSQPIVDTPKIVLPPPLHLPPLSHSRLLDGPNKKPGFHFLSNSDDVVSNNPAIPPGPKFQPLL